MKKKIYADYKKPYINIGYTQESEHLDVYFNVAEYSGYSIDILHQRPGDSIPYPVAETRCEGNYIIWTVTSTDTSYPGKGKLQLHFTLDDIDDQTVIFTTEILRGLIPSSTPSDALLEWYTRLLRASDEAIAAAGTAVEAAAAAGGSAASIANLTVSSESVDSSQQASVTKSIINDVYNLHFGIPRGEKPIYGVDYYTESDKQEIIDAVTSDATNEYNQAVQDAQDGLNDLIVQKTGEFNTNLNNAINEAIDNYDTHADSLLAETEVLWATKVDSGMVTSDGYLVLLADGQPVGDPLGPFSGGGGSGGGSGNNAVVNFSNTTGWRSKSISENSQCIITARWSSIEDGQPTGDGNLKVYVDNVLKESKGVAQGDVSVDVTSYLTLGPNSIKLVISDNAYGNTRQLAYSVNVVSISITSTLSTGSVYGGNVEFSYTPYGNVTKTIYFVLDGTTLETISTSYSGRSFSYIIPKVKDGSMLLTHGHHIFELYFTATIDGETAYSNTLRYDLICTEEGNNTPIIASDFNMSSVDQYETIAIPFYVYTPESYTSDIVITSEGNIISTQTVDRSMQTVTYKADVPGAKDITIQSGITTRAFNFTVADSGIDITPAVTTNLALYLSAYGRSNNESNPSNWSFEDINAQLRNFNFTSDGWQHDSDNNTVLRVSGDARVIIPLKVFESDFASQGKTIEMEFATRDVLNYDATIIGCINGGRGIEYTAQMAQMASEQSRISTQYKEDEHVRITFVVESRSKDRLIYAYINGIMSGVVQYPSGDNFTQQYPVNITIGSNECTVDIYSLRVYDADLTRHEVLTNWIADTQNIDELLERHSHNDVYDQYGNITISKLPEDLPYMVVRPDDGQHMPQFKGDKQKVSGYFVDPLHPEKSFEFVSAEFNVQGTSSQYYPRKNYKVKFSNGFVMTATGETISKYAMNSNAIPTKTFTFKADFASSEGANNVELVRLYNDICPFRTAYQIADPRVRQGIDGFPMVMFLDDGSNVSFVGKM